MDVAEKVGLLDRRLLGPRSELNVGHVACEVQLAGARGGLGQRLDGLIDFAELLSAPGEAALREQDEQQRSEVYDVRGAGSISTLHQVVREPSPRVNLDANSGALRFRQRNVGVRRLSRQLFRLHLQSGRQPAQSLRLHRYRFLRGLDPRDLPPRDAGLVRQFLLRPSPSFSERLQAIRSDDQGVSRGGRVVIGYVSNVPLGPSPSTRKHTPPPPRTARRTALTSRHGRRPCWSSAAGGCRRS